jgi:integrase
MFPLAAGLARTAWTGSRLSVSAARWVRTLAGWNVARRRGAALWCRAGAAGRSLSDGWVRYVHRLLRAALQDALGDGLVSDNAAKNLQVSHRCRPKFTPWTAEQAKQFLVTVREDRVYALYAVALGLGLRRGELLALR